MAEDLKQDRAYKKKKKRILIIVLAIVTLLGAVSYVFTNHGEDVAAFFRSFKKGKNAAHSDYSDELRSYLFYKTDYSLDPTKDEEYMGLDRQLWYHDGGLGVGYDLDDEDAFIGSGDAVLFFAEYFKTVIAGDTDKYNGFFTDRYIREFGEHVRFAPQMLYDIHIHQLSEATSTDGSGSWTFKVEYKIRRNDGTFRNDIPSDGSRALYFNLVGDASGHVLIDSISRKRSG